MPRPQSGDNHRHGYAVGRANWEMSALKLAAFLITKFIIMLIEVGIEQKHCWNLEQGP